MMLLYKGLSISISSTFTTLNGKPIFTYCQNGSTLIQRRNPFSGNNRNYFERGIRAYEEGFGFVQKEMFLGLENIFELNKNNNTVLRIEATAQDDGSKVAIEFDQFILLKEAMDDVTYYFDRAQNRKIRNRTELYPIISLGNQSSYGVKSGQFILINPTYLKNLNEKARYHYRGFYTDLIYASFTTFDTESDYQCARDFRSGWWYPVGMKYDEAKDVAREECQNNNSSKPFSNLNGMFDENKTNNQRQLVHCLMEKVEDCFEIEKNYYGRRIDWHLKNIRILKLTETKMWLKRSMSGIGHKVIVSLKEPILANEGKKCSLKCELRKNPCQWCGKKGFCCSQLSYLRDENCDGTFGGKTELECALKPGNYLCASFS